MYFSAKEILAQLEGTDKRICDLAIQNETELLKPLTIKSWRCWRSATRSCTTPPTTPGKGDRSLSGLTGGSARKMWDYYKKGSMICDGTIIRGAAYALSCLEVNASMGLIVAAPPQAPAASCRAACSPSRKSTTSRTSRCWKPSHRFGHRQLIVKKATVSGAEGGCQAECGSAAAMAAGAVVEMLGGTPAQAFDAAAIAMQNIMGLVCDPVAGLVEMPCAKRNASGVANALVSADLALSGIFSEIPFDEVVEAMYKVGKALPSTLRETALGGVGNHPDRTGDEGKNLRQRRRRICLQRGLRLLRLC